MIEKKKKKKDRSSKNSKISTINQEHKKAITSFIARTKIFISIRNRDESTTKVNTLFTALNSAPFSSAV